MPVSPNSQLKPTFWTFSENSSVLAEQGLPYCFVGKVFSSGGAERGVAKVHTFPLLFVHPLGFPYTSI